MIQGEALKEKMIKFMDAFGELQQEWDNYDCPRPEEDISYKYPFHKSFDELYHDVIEWVHTHTR